MNTVQSNLHYYIMWEEFHSTNFILYKHLTKDYILTIYTFTIELTEFYLYSLTEFYLL